VWQLRLRTAISAYFSFTLLYYKRANVVKRACADKDVGAGNAGVAGGGTGGSDKNCEFKVLVATVPYGSVSNSSAASVRTAALPAQA